MGCDNTGLQCGTIQILEPDGSVPVENAGGTSDPTLTERGELALNTGQSEVSVIFGTTKFSANYRFEYLYVDTLGLTSPGVISCVPIIQTVNGFSASLAGAPINAGYVLRWRVVVVDLTQAAAIDAPEAFRLQMPYQVPLSPPILAVMDIIFSSSRSTTDYGFSELRVENLTDPPATQNPIAIQVVEKRLDGFKIGFSPTPQTANYYLMGRTP